MLNDNFTQKEKAPQMRGLCNKPHYLIPTCISFAYRVSDYKYSCSPVFAY